MHDGPTHEPITSNKWVKQGKENWQLKLIVIPQALLELETSICSFILNSEFQLPVPIMS